jgi:hypothetical protein
VSSSSPSWLVRTCHGSMAPPSIENERQETGATMSGRPKFRGRTPVVPALPGPRASRQRRPGPPMARPPGKGGGWFGGARESTLRGWFLAKLYQLSHDIGERLCGVDLVSARSPQERFNLAQVPENQLALFWSLAIRVRRSLIDPADEHFSRSTQEHDCVEAVIETALVRDRA